jgi:hypothetical protein
MGYVSDDLYLYAFFMYISINVSPFVYVLIKSVFCSNFLMQLQNSHLSLNLLHTSELLFLILTECTLRHNYIFHNRTEWALSGSQHFLLKKFTRIKMNVTNALSPLTDRKH